MANVADLVEYLSRGTCIAWIGSGPSAELGLAGWRGLCAKILEAARRQQKHNFETIERYYRTGKFPQMLGEVARTYDDQFLVQRFNDYLKDPGSEGLTYKCLSQLPFAAYFTTNVETVLDRHVRQFKAVTTYANSEDDLSAVEVGVVPCVVHLHGMLSNPSGLVLTDIQYRQWYNHGSKEYFQTFIKTHLAHDRIVFIGYSMRDPQVLEIQRRLSTNLRRVIPAYAILANVTDAEISEWSRDYNVEVVRYRAVDDDHSELKALLESVARFLPTDPPPRAPRDIGEQSLLQKLYIWHRLRDKGARGAELDAIKSVVLSTAAELGKDTFAQGDVETRVQAVLQSDNRKVAESIRAAILDLIKEGWITSDDGQLMLDEKARQTIEGHSRQFQDLMSTFKNQVQIDLRSQLHDFSSSILDMASDIVVEALMDVCTIRGIELVRLAFGNEPISVSAASDVCRVLWQATSRIPESEARYAIIRYTTDLLTRPRGVSLQVVEYLSRAFFSIQVLKLDPTGHELHQQFLRTTALLVDENVLIPLLAEGEPRHQLCVEMLKTAIDSGGTLLTTFPFAHQTIQHATWAKALVDRFGEQSVDVLNGALGKAGYRPNAFLQGYIEGARDRSADVDFSAYLIECFGGKPDDSVVLSKLGSFGIGALVPLDFVNVDSESKRLWEEVEAFNRELADRRGDDKSAERVQREADAFLIVAQWSKFAQANGNKPVCSFLTWGTSLAQMARNGPYPIQRSVLVSPHSLYEVLMEYASKGKPTTKVKEFMLSSYFHLSAQFIDKKKYSDFFAPLLREYKKTFDEHFELYRKVLGQDVTQNSLEEYDPLDRPAVVETLEKTMQSEPIKLREALEKTIIENAVLQKELAKYKQQEKKRRDYIKKQRQRKQGRK